MPNCPLCQKALEPVRQSPGSPLNSDQFDASKAGDWYCECSNNGRGNAPYAYFWNREVIASDPEPTPPPGCDRGTMINQNLPTALLNIGHRVDSSLPPGTLEVWQDGKRIGRIENIGQR